MANKSPFQLLEINVISAQDLEVVSVRKMKTYATARVTSRKLTSSVDTEGHNNPTWNDKFVFKVDEHFLRKDTSAVMIEIFSEGWLRNKIIGSVRVLVGNLIPPPTQPFNPNNHNCGMRFVALQVRRPSGRPQGILNIGVALLDGSMRSMPLYRQMSASAVGYRDLMDDDHLNNHRNSNGDEDTDNRNSPPFMKPILLRSKSERSERVTFENTSVANSSIVAIAHKKKRDVLERDSSILSISDVGNPFMKKTTKASSVISGAEIREKTQRRRGGRKGKAGSVVSDSVFSKDSMASRHFMTEMMKPEEKVVEVNHVEKKEAVAVPVPVPEVHVPRAVDDISAQNVIDEKVEPEPEPPVVKEKTTKGTGVSTRKFIPYEYGAAPPPKVNQKYVFRKPKSSIWSDSEVGPSPSEVAAAMAEKRYPLDDGQSSVLDGWSYDESVEGLRSKLDRWRTELPPIYDRQSRGGYTSSYQSSVPRSRRRSEAGEAGLFSCYGNIFGLGCQCVCGQPSAKKYPQRPRSRRSPSVGSRSFL